MEDRYESNLRNLIHYSGVAFGAGYLLFLTGLVAIVVETVARAGSYAQFWGLGERGYGSLLSIPAPILLSAILLFIAVLCGIGFGISVIRNSNSRYPSLLDDISSSVSAFSFMILFVGIGAIAAISSIPFASMSAPIFLVIGAVLLLVGYRVFLGQLVESKLTGGILMIVSVVLIYLVALSPLRNLWSLLGSIPLSGFLVAEINIETVSLLVVAVCAVLYAFPGLREGKGSHALRIILSISAIVFGVGLLYFNFSAVQMLSNSIAYLGQVLVSSWLIFFGLLVLGISGIIVIVAASLSLGLSVKELQTIVQMQPPPPPPPPPPAP